jgi:hypothetical protein
VATEKDLAAPGDAGAQAFACRLEQARQAFGDAVDFIATQGQRDPNAAYAGSVPYLMLAGNLLAGWQMGRALLAARRALNGANPDADAAFMHAKIATARFYAEHILPRTAAWREAIVHGAGSVMALPAEAF